MFFVFTFLKYVFITAINSNQAILFKSISVLETKVWVCKEKVNTRRVLRIFIAYRHTE